MMRRPLLLLCFLSACSPDSGAERAGTAGTWAPVRPVRALPIQDLPARVIAPDSRWSLTLPVTAKLVRARAKNGDRVAIGDPLVDVLSPELSRAATIERSSGALVASLGARLANLEKLGASGMSRASERTTLRTELERTRAEYQMARALLAAAGTTKAQRATLRQSGVLTIASPLEGVVIELVANPGEQREPHDSPWLSVVSRAPIRLEVRVMHPLPPFSSAAFHPLSGAPVELETMTSSVSEGRSGAYFYWFEPRTQVMGVNGARGRVVLQRRPASGFVVPAGAIREKADSSTYVLVRRGNAVHEVAVRTISRDGEQATVDGTLRRDDVVQASAGLP